MHPMVVLGGGGGGVLMSKVSLYGLILAMYIVCTPADAVSEQGGQNLTLTVLCVPYSLESGDSKVSPECRPGPCKSEADPSNEDNLIDTTGVPPLQENAHTPRTPLGP